MTPESLARGGAEAGEQAALFCWSCLPDNQHRNLLRHNFFAVNNNAGKGDMIRGAQAKQQGVKSGVADTILLAPRRGFAALLLEMKKAPEHGGRPSDQDKNQKEFEAAVTPERYCYVIAFGWKHAVQLVEWYLDPAGS